MGSLRDILSRSGERDNLLTIVVCALLVLLITAIGFGVANIDYDFQSVQEAARTGSPHAGGSP